MPEAPPIFFPGEAASASKLNALAGLAGARTVVKAGAGLSAAEVGGAVLLSVASGPTDAGGDVVLARVQGVQGVDGDWCEGVKYRVYRIGAREQTLTGWMTPRYFRDFESGVRLEKVAEVDDLCLLFRCIGDDGRFGYELGMLTEKWKREVCTPGNGGPGPGAVSGLMMQVVRADGTIGVVPVTPPPPGGPLGAGGPGEGIGAPGAGAQ